VIEEQSSAIDDANPGTTAGFAIRRANVGDMPGILHCLHTAFEPFRKEYTHAAFADTVLTRKSLRQRLDSMCVFVAVSQAGAVIGTIGCATLDAVEGHLRGMAVLPEWRGTGLAAALLAEAEAELRGCGCTFVSLDTTEPLTRAVSFYEKQGFRPSGRVTDFFGMPIFEYVKRLHR
jgi:ribosomal protein S18 acetylase RimI-like enzyme